ncbi:hypothetical protein H5410_025130 [Solanum commersonii]|uniref:F-box domain-containing protein n=1 Tax=Solanum commersonii TaxID=4109 RepID=A0A9J5YXM7_SOLCO|nr:hypothetical protein H5410_025130 [Solanum commersonii]
MEGEKHTQRRCRRSTKEAHGFVDDMVFEILTWLPAKSLMRFNCVSKSWNSLIRYDLNFVNLHIARSRYIPSPSHPPLI